MFDADVLVLGGGPAGSAAAITAATAGLKVTLIEREFFPRPAPGESVHPGVQPLLRQLGVEEEVLGAGFLRHPGHIVRTSDKEQFIPFGADGDEPWLGFQLWRPDFDSILLRRVRTLGVTVLQPSKVTGLSFDRYHQLRAVTTDGVLRARYVLDATGRWRTVSRWLNLSWKRTHPTRTAWYGYARGKCPARAEIPVLTMQQTGWTWIAQVRPDLFAWTTLNFDNSRPANDWRPTDLKDLQPTGPPAGADVTWEIAREPAGSGYFLLGDAVAVLDPAAGHGLLKALMSGILAGHLVGKVIDNSIPGDIAIAEYNRWTNERFRKDVVELEARYAHQPA